MQVAISTPEGFKNAAEVVIRRLSEMGVTKDGKSLVVDQGYEVVAALLGYRNQHACRKALSQAVSAPTSLETNVLMTQFVPVLKRIGYEMHISEFKRPFWEFNSTIPVSGLAARDPARELDGNASNDFDSKEAAWLDAYESVVLRALTLNRYSRKIWDGMGVACQLLVLEGFAKSEMELALEALEDLHGHEHPFYDREEWQEDLAQRNTRLGNYWEWVQHRIEANGGPENHCEECYRPLDDGEGYDGKCGSCADAHDSAEEPLE